MIMIKITLLASKPTSQEPGYRQCLEAHMGDRWIGSYCFASDSDLPCTHKIQERSFYTDSVFVAFQMFRNWQAGNDLPPPDTQEQESQQGECSECQGSGHIEYYPWGSTIPHVAGDCPECNGTGLEELG